jgi:asparagine N-glycosylation enzyme membrane subunit Stt3
MDAGIMFLSVSLVILTAYSLKRFNDFIEKSKMHKYENVMYIVLLILFVATAIIPSAIFGYQRTGDTPTQNDVNVLKWAAVNLPKDAVITSSLREGNIVAYYAQRKNVMDNNFLLTPRIDQRLSDIDEVYTTTFETKALGILNKYDSKYILISGDTLRYYGINSVPYIVDDKCFNREYYQPGVYLYSTRCKIE